MVCTVFSITAAVLARAWVNVFMLSDIVAVVEMNYVDQNFAEPASTSSLSLSLG